MNKKVVLGAAVLLVPLYVAASWGLGRAAHARFDQFENLANVSGTSIFKVADRAYTPGIFTSEERFTFELNKEIFGGVLGSDGHDVEDFESYEEGDADLNEAADEFVAPSSAELPRFTVLHKVQHGPLPGFRALGLARIESTLEMSDEVRAVITKVIGDQEPIRVTSLIGFTGAGSSTINSPAFEYQDEGEKLSWQGFEGTFDYGRNIDSLECDAKAPGLKVTSAIGLIAELGEISFECDLERAFDSLYIGTAAVKIASLRHTSAAESMRVEHISYVTNARKDGDYVDMAFDFGMSNLELEGFAMDDLRYDLSLNHMHGPTYAAMQRAMEEAVASSIANPADAANVLAVFSEYLPRFLEHSPQLVINRIGFSMPQGEAGLKGTIQFKDLAQDDFAAGIGMALLAKLDASVDLWLSEGLLTSEWTGTAMNAEASDGPSTAEKIAMMQMQVAQLEQQGYIGRNGDRLESRIEFKNGALTANGQPIGPMGGGQ